MRVMFLTTNLAFGGAERVILNLVDCLAARGVECAVAGLFDRGATHGHMRDEMQKRGVPVFCAEMNHAWQPWRLWGVRRFIVQWKPDVLHCHLFHAHMASVALCVRVPAVWNYHTVRRWWWRDLLDRALKRSASAHVFASEAIRAARHAGAGARADERVIHNGIDLAPFLDIAPRAGSLFGALGRMEPQWKGFDLLITAFARLADEYPDARLRIAGDGPIRAELEALARSEGVGDRVEFPGFVRDVPGFLAGVNVFVNPSRWEAFGITLVEGMAAGLPCIASRVGGLPEIGGDLVRWVEPDDVDTLCAAMQDALRSPHSQDDVARQRAHVIARFGRDAMAEKYQEVYRAICAERNARNKTL